jgi:hypothetical protein
MIKENLQTKRVSLVVCNLEYVRNLRRGKYLEELNALRADIAILETEIISLESDLKK